MELIGGYLPEAVRKIIWGSHYEDRDKVIDWHKLAEDARQDSLREKDPEEEAMIRECLQYVRKRTEDND